MVAWQGKVTNEELRIPLCGVHYEEFREPIPGRLTKAAR